MVDDTVAGDGIGADDGRVTCGITPDARVQDWSDVSRGLLAVAHPADTPDEYWLIGTARLGSEVVHWRQGPLILTGTSSDVAIALPESLITSPEATRGAGTVSVRVLAQDATGRVSGAWSLPRVVWTMEGSTDGAPLFALATDWDWSRTITDGEETLVDADL